MQIFLAILSSFILGYICSQIAGKRGRSSTTWFVLGVLFGLIALIVIALLPPAKSTAKNAQPAPIKIPSLAVLSEAHVDKLWYYLNGDKTQLGPMSLNALSRDWREGKVGEKTFVWHEDLSEWKRMSEVLRPE